MTKYSKTSRRGRGGRGRGRGRTQKRRRTQRGGDDSFSEEAKSFLKDHMRPTQRGGYNDPWVELNQMRRGRD